MKMEQLEFFPDFGIKDDERLYVIGNGFDVHQAYKNAITIHIVMAHPKRKRQLLFLLSFTIASIAPDMSRHMNGFAILHPIIFMNAIELTTITILCHNLCSPSFCGGS